MGKNKQASCKLCLKTMKRSTLKRHRPPLSYAGKPAKKSETVEYDKKLLEESEEVLKIYKLLQRMKQDNAK